MLVTLVVINVLCLDLFRGHSVRSWQNLDQTQIQLHDFAENQQHWPGHLDDRYRFNWSDSKGSGFIVMLNESVLEDERHDVAKSNLFVLAVWIIVTAILTKRQQRALHQTPKGFTNDRKA
jgi:hypothetical protein